MAKLIPPEKIPAELKSKLNIVKKRVLFLSPSVASGQEREARKEDFEALTSASIGTGGFGKVYKVRHKVSQNVYAIKVISKTKILESDLGEQIKLEVRIMYSLNHEHIIKLYNHFEDDDYFYLILEFAPKGHLYEKLKTLGRLPERLAAQYMREVVSGVEYLHSLSPPIIHRDIKPENILLDSKECAKVCDFGWSNFFNSDRKRMTYCGTPDYLSPEMIRQEGHDQRIDLWNLGVLLFELLTGRPPFHGANQKELFENIIKLKINYPRDFPKLARDLTGKLLKTNPKDRLPLSSICAHAWFKGNPELRPVLTRKVQLEQKLPTLEHDLQEEDFEAVSRVSKVNREELPKAGPSPLSQTILDETSSCDKENHGSGNVPRVQELERKLQTTTQELQDLRVIHQLTIQELEQQKRDNEDVKQRFKMCSGAEKAETAHLNDELQKLRVLNKSREALATALDEANAALTEALTQNQLLQQDCESLRLQQQSSQEKIHDLQTKLEHAAKSSEKSKQQFEQANYKQLKSQAELEGKLGQLQLQMLVHTPSEADPDLADLTDADIAGAVHACQKGVDDIKTKISSMVTSKKSEEAARREMLTLQRKLGELKTKYETDLYEAQVAVTKMAEETRVQCEAESKRLLQAKDKMIDELTQQLSQLEAQEGRAAIESHNLRSLQAQNAQLQKMVNDAKLQLSLSSKQQLFMQDKITRNATRMQELEYKLAHSSHPQSQPQPVHSHPHH